MKILQCIICKGKLDIIDGNGFIKKIKCINCGFTNDCESKKPEVVIINRKYNI
jgi:hypothetical protein